MAWSSHVRRTAFLCTFLFALCGASVSRAAPLRLRVLTFNAWAVPVVSDERQARIQRVGQAVAELGPDVVAMQEVWTDEDARSIEGALKATRLQHVRFFASSAPVGFGSTGLLIASVYPLADVAYEPFALGTRPHTPWHLDWVAAKGVIRARIETPLGAVLVANTHLQASYRTGNYVPVRIGQMLQIANFLGPFGPRPPAGADEPPVILAGDLNAAPSTVEFQLLASAAGLRPATPDFDIDAVLYRRGTALAMRPVQVSTVMDTPVDLGNGTHDRLSDHPGILVDFELSACGDCTDNGEAPAKPPQELVTDARAILQAEMALCESQARWSLRSGAVALLLAVATVLPARRRLYGRRRSWWGLGLVLLLGAGWLLYFSLGYAPGHLAGLDRTCQALSR
jgi:endonuclease/exonuclease/phosphatase family metal-dependent hydrolase